MPGVWAGLGVEGRGANSAPQPLKLRKEKASDGPGGKGGRDRCEALTGPVNQNVPHAGGMSRTSHPDQLARELMRLRTTSRLKGAPVFHFWEIGQGKRDLFLGLERALIAFTKRERSGEPFNPAEQAAFEQLKTLFADPDLNPYTPELLRQDQETSAHPHFAVSLTFEDDGLILANAAQVTQQLLDHFHPIRWTEFEESTVWDLLCEVLPALQIARVQLDTYAAQRWLYDERSQRAAEALCFRVQAMLPDAQLPAQVPATARQQAIFEDYAARLKRGANPRRWFQDTMNKETRPRPYRRNAS